MFANSVQMLVDFYKNGIRCVCTHVWSSCSFILDPFCAMNGDLLLAITFTVNVYGVCETGFEGTLIAEIAIYAHFLENSCTNSQMYTKICKFQL
jgi:hypothetical protein